MSLEQLGIVLISSVQLRQAIQNLPPVELYLAVAILLGQRIAAVEQPVQELFGITAHGVPAPGKGNCAASVTSNCLRADSRTS